MRWSTRTRWPLWGPIVSRLSLAPRSTVSHILLSIIALTLIIALALAIRNGIADIYTAPAKAFLRERQEADVELTEFEWQAAKTNLQKSLDIVPDDPETLIALGRLHRIQMEDELLDDSAIERHAEIAIDHYEKAASLRPTWPWVWSSLALTYYQLYLDSGEVYHQALTRATHFGPWEEPIQRLVIDLGLDTWSSLNPDAEQAVLVTIDRAIRRQLTGLDEIVDTAEEWQLLCGATTSVQLDSLRRHCSTLLQD